MTLNNILLGDRARILKVKGEDGMRRRLFDLGFIPGEEISCILVSPFKDPRAYLINGNVLAIRNKDAALIEVSYEGN